MFNTSEFDPSRWLEVCESIDNESNTEADIRTILNRTYYASYHYARRHLDDSKIDAAKNKLDNDSEHLAVCQALYNLNKHLGGILTRLWARRGVSDYDLKTPSGKWSEVVNSKIEVSCTSFEANESMELASHLINQINNS